MTVSKPFVAATPSLAPALGLAQEPAPQALEDFTTHRVEMAPGVNLFVREAGEADALILLHGWPQHGLMWHRLAPLLAEDVRVIVPDLRGAGNPSIPAVGYDKVTMAADIVAIMDTLDVPMARVAGHDLGSGVAFPLAAGRRLRA